MTTLVRQIYVIIQICEYIFVRYLWKQGIKVIACRIYIYDFNMTDRMKSQLRFSTKHYYRSNKNNNHCRFFRRRLPEVFYKKGVLITFGKFIRKNLCQSLFFNKVAGWGCFWFLFIETKFTKMLWNYVPASSVIF